MNDKEIEKRLNQHIKECVERFNVLDGGYVSASICALFPELEIEP